MKIQGTIVDKNFKLIGLVMKGKPSEMGMSGKKDWITGPCALADAKEYIKLGLVNNFGLDSEGNIVGLSTNKLSDYPMYDKKGNIVNKQVDIRKIFEDENGILLGILLFIVGLNKEVKLKARDVKFLLSYCEPSNFSLRVRNGIPYIAGKNGTKLEDIPVERKEKVKKSTSLANANDLKVVECLTHIYINKKNKLASTFCIHFSMNDNKTKDFRNKLFSSFPAYIESAGTSAITMKELEDCLSRAKSENEKEAIAIIEAIENIKKGNIKLLDNNQELNIKNSPACVFLRANYYSLDACYIEAKGIENLNKTLKKIASLGYMLSFWVENIDYASISSAYPPDEDCNYLELLALENWISAYASLGCSFEKIRDGLELYRHLDLDGVYTIDDCITEIEEQKKNSNSCFV